MKKFTSIKTLILLAFMTIGSSALITSCKDDPCDDVDCLNGGTCFDGNCSCPDGYEGVNCGTIMADKFEGSWKYNESCGGATVVDFTVVISESAPDKITFNGFAGFECGGSNILVSATVDGREITVDGGQTFCSAGLIIDSGTGTINESGNAINLTYTYTIPGVGSETCSGVYTK